MNYGASITGNGAPGSSYVPDDHQPVDPEPTPVDPDPTPVDPVDPVEPIDPEPTPVDPEKPGDHKDKDIGDKNKTVEDGGMSLPLPEESKDESQPTSSNSSKLSLMVFCLVMIVIIIAIVRHICKENK